MHAVFLICYIHNSNIKSSLSGPGIISSIRDVNSRQASAMNNDMFEGRAMGQFIFLPDENMLLINRWLC